MSLTDQSGWFKLQRNFIEDSVISADAAHFLVWCVLLSKAAYQPRQALIGSKLIELNTGQLVISIRALASLARMSEPTVKRILQHFIQAGRITREQHARCSVITLHPSQLQSDVQPQNKKPRPSGSAYRTQRKPKQSVFGPDASYDLDEWQKHAIGMRPCDPKDPV